MKPGPKVEIVPIWRAEFRRWLRVCEGAGRFGWSEVGFLAGYRSEVRA